MVFYRKTCDSLGLNYLTKPFAYIRLNGKVVLYALKDCAEQLRQRDGVSIYELKTQVHEGVYIVTAYARNKDGKMDVATGAVNIVGLKGEALANAIMKAETKAKRRVTLSICGLGMTDESEIDSIPNAQRVDVDLETGEMGTVDNITPFGEALRQLEWAASFTALKSAFEQGLKVAKSDNEKKMLVSVKDRMKERLEQSVTGAA